MLLLIDNFDSFTYNLVHAFEKLGIKVITIRNDSKTVDECMAVNPSYIVIGPGPGNPSQAGISKSLIKKSFLQKIPLLGVCLGHQAIAEVFGGNVVKADLAMHGKISEIKHENKGVFYNLPSPFTVTRYHSLIVDKKSFPSCLEITAMTLNGEVMALKHKREAIEGVQFHPESIASEYGEELFLNFLKKMPQEIS